MVRHILFTYRYQNDALQGLLGSGLGAGGGVVAPTSPRHAAQMSP